MKMNVNARMSWGFRYFDVIIHRDSVKFLVWTNKKTGEVYQWEKGTRYVENVDTNKVTPVIKVVVKY